MSQSRLIAGLALAAATLLSLGWATVALPGALLATAVMMLAVFACAAFGRQVTAARFAGPSANLSSAPMLVRAATELAHQAGLPTPRLYVTDSEQMNACTLTDADGARIAVSTALLRRLRPEELAAVLAHELAHVRGKDSRRLGTSAVLLGIASLALSLAALSLLARNDSFVSTLFLLLPIFLAAAWTQMALCRAREYRADAVAAALCGHPQWIAAALDRVPDGDDDRAGFSSHPPVRDRITRLHAMAGPWL